MPRLFWKIFLWFWTAMLILTTVVAWSTYQLRDVEGESVMGRAYRQFQTNSNAAAIVLGQQGLNGLQQWLDDAAHRKSMELYVIGLDGRQRLGPAMPPGLQRFIRSELSNPAFSLQNQRIPHWIVSRIVRPPADMPYHLVTTFQRPHPLVMIFTPERILLALLVSGLVCFWLARHITWPIAHLRLATQKLSAGNLDVRVGHKLGRRRDELGRLATDFDRMAEQLQKLLTSQQQLLRDVSHELRSPLARLQVALELARSRSDGRIDSELDRIESEAERLNDLIGQVLALARMDAAGNRALNRQDTNLRQLLEDIVADAQFEAQSRQRQIVIESADDCTLAVDEALLHSAIENIIRNALKYTAAHTPVEVKLESLPQMVRLTIRDHGEGVTAERLDDLFKPFVRLSEARDRDSGGYGLGLAIAERAIQLHDGLIQARNCADGGLSISIELPIALPV
jgi:two-component system sensor histidine kinase CpxA